MTLYITGTFHTTEEIADDVIKGLDDSSRQILLAATEDELVLFHHGLGQVIRNEYNLWDPNHPLVKSGSHPDDVSAEVIKLVWQKLRETVKRKAKLPRF